MDDVVCQGLFSLSRGFDVSARCLTYDPLFKSQAASIAGLDIVIGATQS